MSLKKVVGVFAVCLLAYASVASATTFTLKANVSNAFSAGFATQPLNGGGPYPPAFAPSQNFSRGPVAGASIYQVDFYLNISNITAGMRGFGNIAWNINLGSGLTQSGDLPGWQSDAHFTDTNGALPGGGTALWFVNGDGGTAGDLQGIIQTITAIPTATATDLRARIGQVTAPAAQNQGSPNVNTLGFPDGNTFLGSLYVNWNGAGAPTLTATLTGASNANSEGVLVVDANAVLQNATVAFVPEPATVALMGLGGLGMLVVARRRRRS